MKIIISFDTTGSMYPALTELRRRLSNTIQPLFDTIPDLSLGIIAHGDYNDYYEPQFTGYTRDVELLKQFVNSIGTTSGFGNGGERYEDIMHMVNKIGADVYIMVGDEPPHIKNNIVYGLEGQLHTVKYDILEEIAKFTGTFYLVRCLNRFDSRHIHQQMSAKAGTPLLALHQFSDIPELLSAIVYAQETPATLTEYGDRVRSAGRMNINLAALIDSLLNENRYSPQATTQILANTLNIPRGLIPVDPTRFQIMHIDAEQDIKTFVEKHGIPYKKGRGFYQLTKSELIQEHKEVVLRDKAGMFYAGDQAREVIGLPYGQRGVVRVDRSLPYTVFVQSTSVNRKLIPPAQFLYETI